MTTRVTRRWVSIAVIVLAAGLTAACGGALPPTSWSALVVSGQTAYLASTDRIYAIDTHPETNNLQRQAWAFPPAGQNASVTFHSQPFVSESGILYAGSDSSNERGVIFALDTTQTINTGEVPNTTKTVNVKWSYPAGENPPPLGSVFGGVAYDSDSVYAGTSDGRVISLEATPESEFGRLNWTFPPTTTEPIGRIWASPVVSGERVYVTSQDHYLYALNAATGEQVWKFRAGAMLAGTPTVYGNSVYVGSFDQKLYALDAATGAKKWEFTAQGWLWDGPAIFDNVLYFGDLNGNLYAVGLDGREIWRLTSGMQLTPDTQSGTQLKPGDKLEGMIRAQPLVTTDRIYVVTSARKLFAINRTTKKPEKAEWAFTTPVDGESLLSTPVRVGDSLLIAPIPSGGSPTRLYAVNAKSGNLQWQFPAPQAQP